MKHLDSTLKIPARVEYLLEQMTIDEKVAQLCCVLPTMLMGKTIPDPDLMAKYMAHGLGRITQSGTFAWDSPFEISKLINGIQSWVIENTRLRIPLLFQIEATHGLMAVNATIFPSPLNLANTWDPDLVKIAAEVVRKQALAIGTRQILSPVFDLAQDPRWGRVDETMGEDPYLSASIGGAYVNGLQTESLGNGVAACGKHFIGYSRSLAGLNQADVDLSERDLYEYFAFPFEAVIHEYDLKTVMCTYSSIGGISATMNKKILRNLLREKMGFKGNLLCDGGSVEMIQTYHHAAETLLDAGVLALQAGIEADTPVSEAFIHIPEALKLGKIDIGIIDDAVRSILKLKFELGLFENPYAQEKTIELNFNQSVQDNLALSNELAKESIVLLKNDNNLLPITKKDQTIALIGPHMDDLLSSIPGFTIPASLEMYKGLTRPLIDQDEDVPQKASMGGIANAEEKIAKNKGEEVGAGFENFLDYYYEMAKKLQGVSLEGYMHEHYHAMTLKTACENEAPEGTKFLYAKGCGMIDKDESGLEEAVTIAQKADVVFIAVGDHSSWVDGNAGEGHDSTSIQLPGVQHELIKAVHATGKPIVLVIFGARPHAIVWENENIEAILDVWHPGECGTKAIAQTMFGKNNPSGRLSVTVPRSVGHVPIFYNHRIGSGYLDPFTNNDLVRSIGVAGYSNEPTTPLFHFGYGLSYSQFSYSNLEMNSKEIPIDGKVEISLDVTNTGRYDGDDVVQLYTFDREASVARPVKKITAFKRVTLKRGETKRVVFVIEMNQLAFPDLDMNLVVEPGNIDVMVGASSNDIRLTDSFKIVGDKHYITNDRVYFSKAMVI